MSTFVSVGNATQPFARLLEAVCQAAPHLPQPVFVQYGVATDFSCPGCSAVAFLEMDEFARRVSEAELLILHAGAGSVIHAIRAGKVPVVMARRSRCGEHVDDHQIEFANALAKMGKVAVAEGVDDLLEAVAEASRLQKDRVLSAVNPPMVGLVGEVLQKMDRLSR